MMFRNPLPVILSLLFACSTLPAAKPITAPAGLFKDVDDSTVGDAILLRGTGLFIDTRLIESLDGAHRRLNRPVKHKKNPVMVKTRPWEENSPGYGTVHYDAGAKLFKMWYQTWKKVEGISEGNLGFATSRDGVTWTKPVVNKKTGTNLVAAPTIPGFQCPGIFHDRSDPDPQRRYKMLFSCAPDGTSSSWMTSAAFSPDGIHWTPSKQTPLIPFSDTQICPFWDQRSRRYVAILRFGPPNTRLISRTESEDFQHWSPKITVLRRTRRDAVQETQFYQMAPMPYANGYIGIIGAYHRESLAPIPPDKPWTDRQDLQLAYSRDSVTWSRVGGRGAESHASLNRKRDWTREAREATFLPYGKMNKEWDWGYIAPYYTPEPIIVNDRIHFFYVGADAKHWWTWTGDPPKKDPNAKPPKKGIGLATLRRDGFVSVEAGPKGGTMTTRTLAFLGDTLLVNADASKGSLTVEALDTNGKPIKGFGLDASVPLTTDAIRHRLAWKGHKDLHQLQGRPLRLRFHLKNARLFSVTPSTRHMHYIRSYP
ncbi:MAG: hypothetical protein CMJ65_13795 [Planctomycetaceae bacterium]|jgi:hypothetical protein|nr:hypothetical protein [Planctomycetaceae bacterium]MDP7274570.1 hypothetical protein [Planctomycetaceae bacterium]